MSNTKSKLETEIEKRGKKIIDEMKKIEKTSYFQQIKSLWGATEIIKNF